MADDKRMGLYIPRRLIDDWQLSPPAKMVYAVMLAAADEVGMCQLSAHQIGVRCGISATAVTQNRRKLMGIGYISKESDTSRDFYCMKHLEVKCDG